MMGSFRRAAGIVVGLVSLAALAAACSANTDEDVGANGAANGIAPAFRYSILRAGNRYGADTGDAYIDSVQRVMGSRCAVCHSCTNGPCQLNMTSFAAVARGISSTNPYKFGLFDSASTRVSDNLTTGEWRARGFRGVLPDATTRPEDSLFYKSIVLGKRNTPAQNGVETGGFTTDTARALAAAHDRGDYVCPATGRDFGWLEAKYPMGGMPWALPRAADAEQAVLEAWVLGGAQGPQAAAQQIVASPERTPLTQVEPSSLVASWEGFLNGDALESQLVARYVYEHSFQANIHLVENPGEYYRIVRSRSAAPAAIDRIVTDTPMDAPGAGRVYYRFEKIDRLIEGKTHIVWQLGLPSLARFREIFFAQPWRVAALPGYASKNPFEYFDGIPAAARATFMIENSRMIYQSFAKGPICMIQAATYAVDEYFWIWFLRPESDPTVQEPHLGLDSYASFFSKDGNLVSGVPVLGDKYGEPTYRAAFESTLRRLKPQGLGVADVWTGEGENPNAWLTVHRHQVSTDVTTGRERPITGMPRSVWLISYANFERMYYNAAVTYRYWGSARHQNDTFNWQTYTRTEAEDLYASLYPDQSYRTALRDRFTSFNGKLYNKLFTDYARGRPSRDQYRNEDALGRAVYAQMGPGVVVAQDRLNHWPNDAAPTGVPPQVRTVADFEAGLRTLTAKTAAYGKFMPNVVHVRVGGEHLYTLLANRGYKGDKNPLAEAAARDRADDQVVAIPGFSGFEAHLFFDLTFAQSAAFLRDVGTVRTLDDWRRVRKTYAIARTSSRFWPFVDWLHGWMELHTPVEAGLLELRFYDKDETAY